MIDKRMTYESSCEVRDVISAIGRTEDIKISPDSRHIALIDYLGNRIFLFSIEIDKNSGTPGISIVDYSILSSASLNHPHGVAFLGNEHIVVCNRDADVCVFKIPAADVNRREQNVTPRNIISGKGMLFAKVKTPGSVDSYEIAENCYRIMVCNNHWHMITSHIIEIGDSIRIKNEGILLEKELKVPDGISISADHVWIAVSNHVDGEILIYRNTPELNRATPPVARLGGIVCPHGVKFTPDGKQVLVADAASQYLYVFESREGGWSGQQDPDRLIRLLSDDEFYVARYDSREGGLKGIDIDGSNTLLITTRRYDVIGFYDLGEILAENNSVNQDEMGELCRDRDRSFDRQRKSVLNRHWNYRTRARHVLIAAPRKIWRHYRKSIRARVRSWRLELKNRWSTETLLDPSGPALSLTTHGHRLELVFYAIESIGMGSRKPSRIILWVQDEALHANPPETLRRQMLRGLEIHLAEEFGPHTKYYPYIDREREFNGPLVTADDDILYPREWLQQLIAAYKADPAVIHCYRAHRMGLNDKRFEPYNEWGPCQSTSPSHLNFITGVAGVIYPPEFLRYLKDKGRSFEACCPAGDDIWLTANALRGGFKVAQIQAGTVIFPKIRGSQKHRLFDVNVLSGGNQYQLRSTFTEEDLVQLRIFLLAEGESPAERGGS